MDRRRRSYRRLRSARHRSPAQRSHRTGKAVACATRKVCNVCDATGEGQKVALNLIQLPPGRSVVYTDRTAWQIGTIGGTRELQHRYVGANAGHLTGVRIGRENIEGIEEPDIALIGASDDADRHRLIEQRIERINVSKAEHHVRSADRARIGDAALQDHRYRFETADGLDIAEPFGELRYFLGRRRKQRRAALGIETAHGRITTRRTDQLERTRKAAVAPAKKPPISSSEIEEILPGC